MRGVIVGVAVVFALLIGLSAAFAQTTAATTQPQPQPQPQIDSSAEPLVEQSLYEFVARHFRAYEPMYLLYGSNPDTKIQFSFKYQFFSDPEPGAQQGGPAAWASDFYLAYSQTSLWEIGSDSVDTTYRPELMYLSDPREADWLPGMSRFELQAGVKHESNGLSGAESRGVNIAYISPIFTFGDNALGDRRGGGGGSAGGRGADRFFVAVAPRVWAYFGDISDNPDIYQYEGYGDIRLVAGWRDGFQAAFTGGVGNDWDKGSLQIDLSYPMHKLGVRNVGMYLHAQCFTGYGESLLNYNESDTTFRMGVSLVR